MEETKSPALKIKDFKNQINLWNNTYLASTIIVENKGEVAAKNCIGYFWWPEKNEKYPVSWAVPNPEGKRDINTINGYDERPLDFCAFLISPVVRKRGGASLERRNELIKLNLPEFIIPLERGWDSPEWSKEYRNLEDIISDDIIEVRVKVTAENAEPAHNSVKIDFKKKEIYIPGLMDSLL